VAERPCDCGVLCLRQKSSLCSCRHCRWFCAGPVRHQRCRSYSAGKKNKNRLARPAMRQAGPAQNIFFEGVRSLSPNISQGRGRRPPNTVGVRKLRYPQCIILFCHNTRMWQTDGRTDGLAELRQQYRALHYIQSHGKNKQTEETQLRCRIRLHNETPNNNIS